MSDERERLLRVGALARAVGKTVRAMHLYEELGLVTPVSRSPGGYRLYSPDAITRVNWISKLQDMGFSLPEIQSFLRAWEGAASGPEGMARVRATFGAKLAETRAHLARLRALEKDLAESLAYLEACCTCEPSHVQPECGGCGHHGHDPAKRPELVAGLTSRPGWDVPLAQLSEGTSEGD